MKSTLLCLTIAVIVAFATTACSVGGEVVKVTTVKEGKLSGAKESKLSGLKEDDLAKLEEIKKAAKGQHEVDTGISHVIEATPHYSISDYLLQHPEVRGAAGADYKVGGYDVLNITVYEEKDLSREAVRVSGDGYISFPLIGRIMVNNLTTSEIEKLISTKLAEQEYLLDAHVSVLVTGYNSKRFLVLGAAKTPGSYSLEARERVLDAISRAGGVNLDDAGKKGMIIRTENINTPRERKIVIDIDLQGLLKGEDQISNIFMMDKDVLFIPKAEYFYIIGQVKNPGSYPITGREITLVEAISTAGGFTDIAARNKTRIIRVEKGVEKIIQVQVDAITDAGKKIQDVLIQPNDIIVVPESFF